MDSKVRPRVFIAHASEDSAAARRLFDFLQQNGCDPWIDVVRLSPGVKWKPAIRRAIRKSDFFVACLSTRSVSKVGYFQDELREAVEILRQYPDENIFLIPARLEECLTPLTIDDQQWVNLYEPGGDVALLTSIEEEWAARCSGAGESSTESVPAQVTSIAEADRSRIVLNELREALERDQLTLYYQPKVQLSTECVAGVEALLRWKHPRRGLLCPSEVLCVAEASSLIDDLTRWVIDHALEQWVIWDRAGLDIPVGVNVSARNLRLPTLPNTVGDALVRWSVPSSRLQIEITETAVVEDIPVARGVLSELERMGVSVAIDDFGTGQACLNRLNVLSLSELKLDRPLIEGIEHNEKQQAMVEALVQMGHNLGLRVIAEGVESRAGLAVLLELRCDEVQGYFLSRPLPPRELVRWLVNSKWTIEASPPESSDQVTVPAQVLRMPSAR